MGTNNAGKLIWYEDITTVSNVIELIGKTSSLEKLLDTQLLFGNEYVHILNPEPRNSIFPF